MPKSNSEYTYYTILELNIFHIKETIHLINIIIISCRMSLLELLWPSQIKFNFSRVHLKTTTWTLLVSWVIWISANKWHQGAIFPIETGTVAVFLVVATKKLQLSDRHDQPFEINISVHTIATSWYVSRKIYRASLRRQTSAKLGGFLRSNEHL